MYVAQLIRSPIGDSRHRLLLVFASFHVAYTAFLWSQGYGLLSVSINDNWAVLRIHVLYMYEDIRKCHLKIFTDLGVSIVRVCSVDSSSITNSWKRALKLQFTCMLVWQHFLSRHRETLSPIRSHFWRFLLCFMPVGARTGRSYMRCPDHSEKNIYGVDRRGFNR